MLGRDRDAILEAARERLRLWDITDAQIRAIEASGKPIRTLTLFSPISGYVTQKMVVQGMRIMPGEKLFDIADLSTRLGDRGRLRVRAAADPAGARGQRIA